MTSTVQDPIELLRDNLEEQLQRNTNQLAELTLRSQQPGRGGYDHDTLAALIASARQSASDTAHALRRMAEGSYGTCEHCTVDIPAATAGDPAACPVLRAVPKQARRLTPPASAPARRCTRQDIGTLPGGLHAFLVDPTAA